jgi:short subunit dehydrogenase-like uncharacterized protein
MTNPSRIVVIGATGYTGRLVARELAGGTAPFLLTGRSRDRLAELAGALEGAETREVDVTRPASVDAALRPGDVVINCAGPFTDLGEPVVGACIRAGAHYLDTTGEQRFMKRILDEHDEQARAAGVVVVNAMAFEYAIGDCAAALAAEGLATPLRSVDVVYAWGGGAAASSRGTRRSILRVLREGGYAYQNGRWESRYTGAVTRAATLPGGRERSAVWFPAGEILTVPRHTEVESVQGWMVMDQTTASLLPRIASVMPTVLRLVNPVAQWLLGRAPEGPTPEQREASRFVIRVEAVGADGTTRIVTAQGRDPYGLTAAIAVHGAMQLLGGSDEARGGVLAPAQVLRPHPFRRALEGWGVTLQEKGAGSA